MSPVGKHKTLLQALLGALLIAVLCAFVDLRELWKALATISFYSIAYLFLIAVLMIWISCVKWRMFLRSQGTDTNVFFLMRLYTIGYFVNTFTPSFIGGDIVRSLHLGDAVTNKRDAFVATFLERFTGLLAMSLLGLVFVVSGANATRGVETAVVFVGIGALTLAAVVFYPPLQRLGLRIMQLVLRFAPQWKFMQRISQLTERMVSAAQSARTQPLLITKAMGLSFVYHVLTVINTQAAAQAIGWHDVNIAGLFVVVPLVLLVGMAPVTPSGIGVQEGAFLYFLQRIGGTREQSLGVGVVLRAKVLLIALIGWLLWVTMKNDAARTEQKKHAA